MFLSFYKYVAQKSSAVVEASWQVVIWFPTHFPNFAPGRNPVPCCFSGLGSESGSLSRVSVPSIIQYCHLIAYAAPTFPIGPAQVRASLRSLTLAIMTSMC